MPLCYSVIAEKNVLKMIPSSCIINNAFFDLSIEKLDVSFKTKQVEAQATTLTDAKLGMVMHAYMFRGRLNVQLRITKLLKASIMYDYYRCIYNFIEKESPPTIPIKVS